MELLGVFLECLEFLGVFLEFLGVFLELLGVFLEFFLELLGVFLEFFLERRFNSEFIYYIQTFFLQ
jgi:hypothetical protein